MLPLPDLDDRTFKQIVENARKMIPGLIPQWTDENSHDPGVTFIELLAWLVEMQQYHLDRVTAKNELKFLKLMGIKLKSAASAKTDVIFNNICKTVLLPKGTQLGARDEVFETAESLLLLPTKIEKIISVSGTQISDCSMSNKARGIVYYPFGSEVKKGNRLYIGLDSALPADRDIHLMVNAFEDYPVAAMPHGKGTAFLPSAKLSWEYYGETGGRSNLLCDWLPLHMVEDRTIHMHFKGPIVFKIHSPMLPVKIDAAPDMERYWVRCTVEEEGYETPPKARTIEFNTVKAVQHKTICETHPFSSSGKPDQEFELTSYLALYGKGFIQVRDQRKTWSCWEQVEDFSVTEPDDLHFILRKDQKEKKCTLLFGNGKQGKIPPAGNENIRLVLYGPTFECKIGRSNGLPAQVFSTNNLNILPGSFKMQVGIKPLHENGYVWEDWEMVDDFDTSRPVDRHYILKADTGEIIFGNNENGMIPQAADSPNICILSCSLGGGKKGNVKENEINSFLGEIEGYEEIVVFNYNHASGGEDSESIEDAKLRARRELKRQHSAVTSEDFEEIARSTPGLRVARAKAIPLFEKGLKGYPGNKRPAQVSVVVVPYSESEKPTPSMGFLETVRRHLDPYRLITTEVHVIAPEYIKVTVNAVVVVESHIKFDKQKIIDALNEMLSPLNRADCMQGWSFGRTVHKGDIYGRIKQINGVEYIRDLWLHGEGTGMEEDAGGDIKIPPHGLVYSGVHSIDIVSKVDA